MNMLDDVELQIAKLSLGPDDVLAVRVSKPMTSIMAAELRAQIMRITGLDHVLITDSTIELSVVSKTDAKRNGK